MRIHERTSERVLCGATGIDLPRAPPELWREPSAKFLGPDAWPVRAKEGVAASRPSMSYL